MDGRARVEILGGRTYEAISEPGNGNASRSRPTAPVRSMRRSATKWCWVTESEWAVIADRLEAAWPLPAMTAGRRAVYFDVLHDLDAGAVREACGVLMAEDRDSAPAPGVIRQQALGAGAPGAAVREAAQTQSTPAPPPTPALDGGTKTPAAAPTTGPKRDSQKAMVSLVFGILSIFMGFASVLAIVMGALALRDMKREPSLGGANKANWGIALGAFGATLWIGFVVVLLVLGLTNSS